MRRNVAETFGSSLASNAGSRAGNRLLQTCARFQPRPDTRYPVSGFFIVFPFPRIKCRDSVLIRPALFPSKSFQTHINIPAHAVSIDTAMFRKQPTQTTQGH
jgi:hypothetical protein